MTDRPTPATSPAGGSDVTLQMPAPPPTPYALPDSNDPKDRYLHLLKLTLTGLAQARPLSARRQPGGDVEINPLPATEESAWVRYTGQEMWPADSFTMIGMKRLHNIQACVEDVLDKGVPGDLIETGIWRGGAAIFMRALLAVHSVHDRIVYAADSFQGVPRPNKERYPADTGRAFWQVGFLAVPLDEVRRNFEKFDLLDDQVRFVEGWFQESLPALADRTWSVIRMDGDLYESTINALDNLYPKLSVGGYLIVDDYGRIEPCRKAVDDYRKAHGIDEEIREVDFTCIYWQRTR